MNEDPLQSYGVWIRRRRKDRNLSIRQVSEATRIDEHYLRALEAGNVALLPEPYMRAFLKTYASYLGLDSEEALRRFEVFLRDQSERLEMVRGTVKEREGRRHQAQAPSPEEDRGERIPAGESRESTTEISRRFGMVLAAAVILLFAAVVYLAVYLTGVTEAPGTDVRPVDRIPAAGLETGQAMEEPSAEVGTVETNRTQAPTAALATAREQLLIAEALDETWMEARADGVLRTSRVIPLGDVVRLAFRDTLELKLGKNRGMRLTLNGEEITDLGPPGMVIRMILTAEGVVLRRLTYPPDTIPPIPLRPACR